MNKVLVTGGGGFVGSAIVKSLRENGCEVVVAGRNRYPHLEHSGVSCMRGDIRNKDFTDRICNSVDTVFHTAAKAGIWGPWEDYRDINILGTKNIVDSCIRCNVETFIYTSTPSVVFNNADIIHGDESLPYAEKFLCHYSKSKVAAEKYVLAHNSSYFKTCAIRPHLIYGPGDPHLVPRLIQKGLKHELKIVGSGRNRVDISYIDNVVHAHILAANSLKSEQKAAGKAYFIGQESAVSLWDWINNLYSDLNIPRITRKVPFHIAYIAGALFEVIYKVQKKGEEPKMTRFLAHQLARSHYFSHARAENDFGYQPIVNLAEGQKKLIQWLQENEMFKNL